MRSKIAPPLLLLAGFVLCGCASVVSKKPVGDNHSGLSGLDPDLWNGKWQDGEGTICSTQIKNAKLGIVEVTIIKQKNPQPEPKTSDSMKQLLAPPPPGSAPKRGLLDVLGIGKPAPKEAAGRGAVPPVIDIFVRSLDEHVVVASLRSNTEGVYEFGRVVIQPDFLVFFPPEAPSFASLIKQGKIAGELEKGTDGVSNSDGSCVLESFSGEDYQRLKKDGVDVRALFDSDPLVVFTRIPPEPQKTPHK